MEQYDWINANQSRYPSIKPKALPKADKEVSHIVGKKVTVNDPRLIKFNAERRKLNSDTDGNQDIPLTDKWCVDRLKEIFN